VEERGYIQQSVEDQRRRGEIYSEGNDDKQTTGEMAISKQRPGVTSQE